MRPVRTGRAPRRDRTGVRGAARRPARRLGTPGSADGQDSADPAGRKVRAARRRGRPGRRAVGDRWRAQRHRPRRLSTPTLAERREISASSRSRPIAPMPTRGRCWGARARPGRRSRGRIGSWCSATVRRADGRFGLIAASCKLLVELVVKAGHRQADFAPHQRARQQQAEHAHDRQRGRHDA